MRFLTETPERARFAPTIKALAKADVENIMSQVYDDVHEEKEQNLMEASTHVRSKILTDDTNKVIQQSTVGTALEHDPDSEPPQTTKSRPKD